MSVLDILNANALIDYGEFLDPNPRNPVLRRHRVHRPNVLRKPARLLPLLQKLVRHFGVKEARAPNPGLYFESGPKAAPICRFKGTPPAYLQKTSQNGPKK